MALETTTNRQEYSGNGVTTAFSFPYYFLAEADLVVIKRDNTTLVETIQVITTNYTITGEGEEAGGTVTMVVAPAAGTTLIIYRNPAITQEQDYRENDALPAEQVEQAFDKGAMISQRLSERIDRSARVSEGFSLAGFDLTLPNDLSASGSAGKSLIVNATEDGFDLGLSTADVEAAEAAAAASAAAAAASQSAAASSASSASTSAGTATTQAAAAAASAAAAAASAAANIWRDVVFLTFADSPRTILASERGKLFAVDTAGGAVAITLPEISTLDLTSPFVIGIKKTSGDANAITVSRSGTDTIDGATSKSIAVANSGATFIPDTDPSPDTWTTADFGASAGNLTQDKFSGTGAQTAFTLSVAPGSETNTFVFVSGVYQSKDNYSVSGTTLTFVTAPPTGTDNIEVMIGTLLTIGTPSDGTVSTAKLADLAVTTGKLAAGAVTDAKTAFTAPTIQRFTSGSGTYTTPANVKYLNVKVVGGGGGGGSSATGGVPTSGGAGGNSTFGSSLLTANGGGGGTLGTGGGGGQPGSGGTATVSSPAIGSAFSGGGGGSGSNQLTVLAAGGNGGSSIFGGNGSGGTATAASPSAGATNSGGGGGGAGSASGASSGGGGGAGGGIDALIYTPSATYSYEVGAAGSAGAGGTGTGGAAGGSGYIEVTEYYQ